MRYSLLLAAYLLLLGACVQAGEVESSTCNAPESMPYYFGYDELLCEGITQLEAGQTADAVKSFEELLDLRIHEAPNYAPLSLMALAYWRNGDAEKAQAMLKKAELSLEVLVGATRCIADQNGAYQLHRKGNRLRGPIVDEVNALMCSDGYEYIYEQKSLEIVHSDAQLIQRYFDVRDEIESANNRY